MSTYAKKNSHLRPHIIPVGRFGDVRLVGDNFELSFIVSHSVTLITPFIIDKTIIHFKFFR